MQDVAALDLHFLEWSAPEFAENPWPEFERARAKHPWLARTSEGYAVFDLHAIRDLMVRDDALRPSFDGIVEIMDCRGSPWGRFAEEQMIALPDREHKFLRDTFARKFTPRYANQLRPVMRETMERLLAEWAPREKIDFEEFASYYPIAVTAQMVGAPLSVIPGLRTSMETMGLAFSMDKSRVPALDAAFEHLDAFAHDLFAQRRAKPREGQEPDLLDMLIEAGAEGDVSERQLADLIIFLFVAGYDTSKNVLTYMMHLMVDNPAIYERCAEDLDYCRRVVEETLRVFNPSSAFRVTTKDIEYRDVRIPAGTILFFNLNVAGHDPNLFADPDRFDPDRPIVAENRHVAFGMGKHMCLGQYIARAQLQEGIHLIAQHMRRPHADGIPGWRPFPGVWGIKGLPIEFTPA
ncbi:cytochrome P450 [Novosphingobium album (ex Hu et al. 2023)]|uniref:Cytochrome P450 n=1 Tax=Novosphingobium album (ex Hu et al. 2023) TaxID=2930093 RepID=A0ABT0AXI5_9SPHN|nr:cytochrome P450 [Novosphingobium album (ex Hu et al. 2023)]MCJ2177333.1 cytochrome P450 [Novosphingobium album (ex Hu et al. 2023)]